MLYVIEHSDSMAEPAEGEFILHFNHAPWHLAFSQEALGEALDEPTSMLLLTGREYAPAWVLALEDTEFLLSRQPKLEAQPKKALELFCRALRYHLDRQPDDNYFLWEHPKGSGHFQWVVGQAELWKGVLYIEGGITYPSEAGELGLSYEKMKQKFPDTPKHYVDKRLPDDYLPPSLEPDPPDPPPRRRRKRTGNR